jgi:hypothetical protein
MDTEAQIIKKGKEDYFAQKGVYKNPYPPASDEFNHYERGWTQSLKLDEGRLAGAALRPPQLVPQRARSQNRYAELKGRSGPLRKGPGGDP